MNLKKVLSLVLVGVICLGVFSGCGEGNKNTTTTTTEITSTDTNQSIVMVAGNDNEGFYKSIKKGAEDAANKYGYKLDYMGTDDETSNVVSTHKSNINMALESGVSGVVIVPLGEGYSDVYSRLYDEKIPVVQIDNLREDDFEKLESNKKNPIVSTVLTSYEGAGALCAEKLFEEVKEEMKKSDKPFVIVAIQRADNVTDEEKTNGFIEKFSELADADPQTKDKYRVETESEDRIEDSFDEVLRQNVKAVFITHPVIADKMSDVVFAQGEKFKDIIFCGFDSGAKQLNWLNSEDENTAKFIGGVAQNAYDLGYNAVEQCVFSIEEKDVKEKVEIQGQWYDKSNFDKMKQEEMISEK